MLTDIFATRYEDRPIWDKFDVPERTLVVQGFRIVAEQVMPYGQDGNNSHWTRVESKLTMELGKENLSPVQYGWYDANKVWISGSYTIDRVCKTWMLEDCKAGSDPDRFIKERISFIELAFRDRMEHLNQEQRRVNGQLPTPDGGINELLKVLNANAKSQYAIKRQVFEESGKELNERFRRAKAPLNYHNGFIQIVADPVTQVQITDPFWKIVAAAKWQNVNIDMAEAVDRRDTGGRDPSLYAAKALESVIKIISDDKGWTTGNEKGAANYIDNLVSQTNGRFIEVWEADALKHYFGKLRNPMGHGPGNAPMIALTPQQTDWAIETAMSWCKSLIER